jgi:mycothiol system anti-sigma-R factor
MEAGGSGDGGHPSEEELALWLGGSDCQQAMQTLYHFLDGELTAERRKVIQRHLEECAPCLDAFDFEAELKVVIARNCHDPVPEHLRKRVLRALTEAQNDPTSNGMPLA